MCLRLVCNSLHAVFVAGVSEMQLISYLTYLNAYFVVRRVNKELAFYVKSHRRIILVREPSLALV